MDNFALDKTTYVEDNISFTSNSVKKSNNKNSNNKQLSDILNEYRLTQNNFNPNKKSPPNIFLNKLQQRMSYYYNSSLHSEIDSDFKIN